MVKIRRTIYYIVVALFQIKGLKLSSRPEIDEVDVKIIRMLLKDARISFAEIAENCQMSTNAIRTRFMKLKECGVITGSTIQVRAKSLGYEGIALLAIEADVNKEEQVLEFLKNVPNMILSHSQIGEHNIISVLMIKNVGDLVSTLEGISRNPHIKKADTAITTSPSHYYPENLVIEPFKRTSCPTETYSDENKQHKVAKEKARIITESIEKNQATPSVKLDKVDLAIIRILSQNARTSFRKIANKLGITTKTVIQRYQKLRKDVISSTTITINLTKLGYISNAIFCLNISHLNKKTDIINRINRLPNVIFATTCVGGIDALAAAPLANFSQLFKLKQKIAKIKGIKKIEILLEETYATWPPKMFSKNI